MTIVTTHYRYERPPGKRKPFALEVPAVVKAADPVKARTRVAETSPDATPANTDRQPAIVTIRRQPEKILPPGLLPETPEEANRRADAADALLRELVRRVAGKP